jgi:3-phosphoshikimate 1-carboxyvinyltransferase
MRRRFEDVRDSFVVVQKGRAKGSVRVPTSKSIAHRALICAALAPKSTLSVISRVPYNEDIDATLDCLESLGVHWRKTDELDTGTRRITIEGTGGVWRDGDRGGSILRCRESGSTLRFMLPLCLLSDSGRTFTGSERLLKRPLDDYRPLFSDRSWIQGEISLDIGWARRLTEEPFIWKEKRAASL